MIPPIQNPRAQQIFKNLQDTGVNTYNFVRKQAQATDKFIRNNKTAQVAIGGVTIAAVIGLAILCIKGIFDKTKEVKDKD